jgi:hypothetical protein
MVLLKPDSEKLGIMSVQMLIYGVQYDGILHFTEDRVIIFLCLPIVADTKDGNSCQISCNFRFLISEDGNRRLKNGVNDVEDLVYYSADSHCSLNIRSAKRKPILENSDRPLTWF